MSCPILRKHEPFQMKNYRVTVKNLNTGKVVDEEETNVIAMVTDEYRMFEVNATADQLIEMVANLQILMERTLDFVYECTSFDGKKEDFRQIVSVMAETIKQKEAVA